MLCGLEAVFLDLMKDLEEFATQGRHTWSMAHLFAVKMLSSKSESQSASDAIHILLLSPNISFNKFLLNQSIARGFGVLGFWGFDCM